MKKTKEVIESTKSKLESVYNPTPIEKEKLTIEDFISLGDNESIIIKHPNIEGLVLEIRKDFMVDKVLGVPVIFYGNKYIISDNDKYFPDHELLLTSDEMVSYVNSLLEAEGSGIYNYKKILRKKNLFLGDIIEFEDGSKGKIVIPDGIFSYVNIMFIPFKKDGTLSKHKPRYLYANVEFRKVSKS